MSQSSVSPEPASPANLADHHDAVLDEDFRCEVLAGLTGDPKTLPCKWLYDERGSQLFDQICEAGDYYPTRTEMQIMRSEIADIASEVGRNAMLIEYGSGSSMKTRLLLDACPEIAGYVPLDISREHLLKAAEEIAKDYPHLPIYPVVADYTQPFELPEAVLAVEDRVVYFPGSTIGNFHPEDARAFLKNVARVVGPGGGMLVGVDLRKDPARLEAAYNDSDGATAAFNLNLLTRMNRELGSDFPVERFEHRAVWNPDIGRVEMRLWALDDCVVSVGGETIAFEAGESIHTESSYKYTLDGFAELVDGADFRVEDVWTDPDALFSIQLLRRKG